MTKNRLEAFSDGVLAIVITIMVLELKVPEHDASWSALLQRKAVFVSYVLSFVFLGIYWNNHHHLLHTVERVTGRILWTNLHLLFWLSLVPFTTAWMGENHFASVPTATYGIVLLLSAAAWLLLQRAIIAAHGSGSKLKAAVGRDAKGLASALLYVCAIPLAFVQTRIALALYFLVALIWFIPDRRIEAVLQD